MAKNPKWRVGVTSMNHFMVEVDAATPNEACELALKMANQDPDYYRTGVGATVTGCFVNDKEAREFAAYVPEFIERKENGM